MKKFLFIFALLVMTIAAKAQLFVAGGASVVFSGSSSTTAVNSNVSLKGPQESGFSITPAIGYMIPEKPFGVGLILGYSYESTKEYDLQGDLLTNDYSNTLNVAPFFRLVYARFPSITLYADMRLPITVVQLKHQYANHIVDGNKNLIMGARLIPGLTYKFNKHILFTTEIGLLSISYLHTKSTSPDGNNINRKNDFTFGANNRTAASFGFVYLF